MANIDAPKGLTPIRHQHGAPIAATGYILKTGEEVFKGDVLRKDATGTVYAAPAASAQEAIGVAAHYMTDSLSAGGKKILVYDDPSIIFAIQQESSGSIAAADVHSSADHVAGAGSGKLSGHELSSTLVQGAGAQFLVLGLYDEPENAYGENAVVEVMFNQHALKGAGSSGT